MNFVNPSGTGKLHRPLVAKNAPQDDNTARVLLRDDVVRPFDK